MYTAGTPGGVLGPVEGSRPPIGAAGPAVGAAAFRPIMGADFGVAGGERHYGFLTYLANAASARGLFCCVWFMPRPMLKNCSPPTGVWEGLISPRVSIA